MCHLIQIGASEHVSRVNQGLQSAFRESIGVSFDSDRGFRACFVSQSGTSERVSRINWFSSGLQSTFRESIDVSFDSVWGFRACFASQLVQIGTSERVTHTHTHTHTHARPDFAELDVSLGQHILLTLE